MTDEQLAIISSIVYVPGIKADQTLGEWAANFNWETFIATGRPDNENNPNEEPRYVGGFTAQQMKQLLMTIQHDPVLSNAYIRDVEQRGDLDPTDNDNPPKVGSPEYYQDSPGVNITITSGDSMIVAYKGTSRDQDWIDNGKGGSVEVTDTPGQKEALEYLNRMNEKYGGGYSNIVTTGHSRGGNLAAYAAVVSGFVDKTVSFDGQGFNQAFISKYAEQVDAQRSKITTYSSSLDVVNTFFISISGQTVYISDSGLSAGQFFYNHALTEMLQWEGSKDEGSLRLRDEGPQNLMVQTADELMDYIQKFMPAASFSQLCNMMMLLQAGVISLEDIMLLPNSNVLSGVPIVLTGPPAVKVAELAAILQAASLVDLAADAVTVKIIVNGILDGSFSFVDPRYRQTFQDLWVLLVNFCRQGGLDDDRLAAIATFLWDLIPGSTEQKLVVIGFVIMSFPQVIAGATVVVVGGVSIAVSSVPTLPYSARVRDFSDAVKQELISLLTRMAKDGSVPGVYDPVFNRSGKLNFTYDEQVRRAWCQSVFQHGEHSKQAVEESFDAVRASDQGLSQKYAPVVAAAQTLRTGLTSLASAIRPI